MKSRRPVSEVCLLLGSNIEPHTNLVAAINLLKQLVDVVDISLFWETPAVGSDGPNFWNAAVLVRTRLDAEQLKTAILRPLETRLGRQRSPDKNAPRTMDMDIVAWDCQVTDPNVWRYAYAAIPVAEILPCDAHSALGESLELVAQRLARHTPMQSRAERL